MYVSGGVVAVADPSRMVVVVNIIELWIKGYYVMYLSPFEGYLHIE